MGERAAVHPLQPGGQLCGGGLHCVECVVVAAGPGLFGQVGAGAQARRQQLSAIA